MTDLERRYRRLLALYPADHRRVYEDEMLGVLMAGAGPGQRYPGAREAVDLLWTATRARLRSPGAGLVDSQWADAVAVLGVLTAMLLLGKHLRPLASDLGWFVRWGGDAAPRHPSAAEWLGAGFGEATRGPRPSPADWLRAAVWSGVVGAVVSRRRIAAAIGAWAAVLGEVLLLAMPALQRHPSNVDDSVGLEWMSLGYRFQPFERILPPTVEEPALLAAGWPLLLAMIAAAALTAPGGPRRGLGVLGRRRTMLFAAAATVAAMAPLVLVFLWKDLRDVEPLDPGMMRYYPIATVDMQRISLAAVATYAVVAALVAVAIAGIAPPVRRRVLALLAPGISLLAILQLGYTLPFSGAVYAQEPILAGPTQWSLLVAAPLLVFAAGLLVVRRRQREPDPSAA